MGKQVDWHPLLPHPVLRPASPPLRGLKGGKWRGCLLVISLVIMAVFGAGLTRVVDMHALSLLPSQRQTLEGFPHDRRNRILPADLRTFPFAFRLSFQQLRQHPLLNVASPLCSRRPERHVRYAPLRPAPPSSSTASPYSSPTDSRLAPPAPFQEQNERPPLRYMIAINLYNSEAVLPVLISTLLSVIEFLGSDRFYISIWENGSEDATPAQLYVFAQLLRQLNVGYTIISREETGGFEQGKRIQGLAELRNSAMRPLKDVQVDRVIWLNDVFLCPDDLLELLLQHESQGADMSCGMDYKELRISAFNEASEGYPLLFYDTWIARDMQGLPFYNISDDGVWQLPAEPLAASPSQPLFASHDPFQVYSCFNGLAVLPSSLFDDLHFRTEGDDSQSECFLLCHDLWREKGDAGAKIQIVPRSSVGYTLGDYERARKDHVSFGEEQKVQWQSQPPEKIASYPYAHWDQLEWISTRNPDQPIHVSDL